MIRSEYRKAGVAAAMGLLAVLAACGDGAGPAEPPPDILGVYGGSWSFRFTYTATDSVQEILCPGALNVASQVRDGTFTGTWTQEASGEDCNEASGTLSGIIAQDGAITIVSLSSDGGGGGTSIEDVTEGECVTTGFDDAYRGTADGSTFRISYAIYGDCGQSGSVSWVTTFSGVLNPEASRAPPIH